MYDMPKKVSMYSKKFSNSRDQFLTEKFKKFIQKNILLLLV